MGMECFNPGLITTQNEWGFLEIFSKLFGRCLEITSAILNDLINKNIFVIFTNPRYFGNSCLTFWSAFYPLMAWHCLSGVSRSAGTLVITPYTYKPSTIWLWQNFMFLFPVFMKNIFNILRLYHFWGCKGSWCFLQVSTCCCSLKLYNNLWQIRIWIGLKQTLYILTSNVLIVWINWLISWCRI